MSNETEKKEKPHDEPKQKELIFEGVSSPFFRNLPVSAKLMEALNKIRYPKDLRINDAGFVVRKKKPLDTEVSGGRSQQIPDSQEAISNSADQPAIILPLLDIIDTIRSLVAVAQINNPFLDMKKIYDDIMDGVASFQEVSDKDGNLLNCGDRIEFLEDYPLGDQSSFLQFTEQNSIHQGERAIIRYIYPEKNIFYIELDSPEGESKFLVHVYFPTSESIAESRNQTDKIRKLA